MLISSEESSGNELLATRARTRYNFSRSYLPVITEMRTKENTFKSRVHPNTCLWNQNDLLRNHPLILSLEKTFPIFICRKISKNLNLAFHEKRRIYQHVVETFVF